MEANTSANWFNKPEKPPTHYRKVKENITCPICEGSGLLPHNVVCPSCFGTGKIDIETWKEIDPEDGSKKE